MSWWWEFVVGLGMLESCVEFRRLRRGLGCGAEPLLWGERSQLCRAGLGPPEPLGAMGMALGNSPG